MDATAVSISSGLTIEEHRVRNGLKLAASFGVFQALMPVLGWLAGISVLSLISEYDHWIAFGLLGFIGGRMVYNGLSGSEKKVMDPSKFSVILLLSVATSIDALAAGLSFALLKIHIFTVVIIIGSVTFVLSALGFGLANQAGKKLSNEVEIIGGLILIGIGIKILIQHLFFQPVP